MTALKRLISIITMISMIFTLLPMADAFAYTDKMTVDEIRLTDSEISKSTHITDDENELYYDASKDTLAEAARKNSAVSEDKPGETRVRESSKDKVIPEEDLPASCNISTSKHIPPITSQKTIGSCASMSLTYMQFTNAISRYIESNNVDDTWNPKLNKENRFSPKWTYNFVGGYTPQVYSVQYENGVMTTDKNDFFVNYSYETTEDHAWDFTGAYDGFAYRLKKNSYDSYNTTQMTTTDYGKKTLNAIKSALAQGNVVKLGGYFNDVIYGTISGAGELGSVGQHAIVAAAGNKTNAHAMSIVGYDDTIEAIYNSVTLTGALLVANSHGTNYKNNGYIWVMYDSLNKISEHDILNDASLYESAMNITIDDDLAVYSPSNYTESSNWSFEDVGDAQVNGKTYTAYNIGRFNYIDGSVGPYISYSSGTSDDVVLTNYVTKNSRWCMIPYEDIIKWSSFDKSNYSEKHLGTYWLYAVDKESSAPVFLNSGTDKETEGNDLKLSKFSRGIPETKSFSLPNMNKSASGNFTTKIIVDETKPEAKQRHEAFYNYYITYWDSDYILEKPNLILGVTVQAYDRYDCSIQLFNSINSTTKSYTPIMYKSGTSKVYTGCAYSGKKTSTLTEPETVTMYFNLDELGMDSDKEYTDYKWGAKIKCDSPSGHDITVTSVEIISGRNDQRLAGGTLAEPVTITKGNSVDIDYNILPFDPSEKPTITAVACDDTIEVNWSTINNASGYYLYRKASTDAEYTLIKDCKPSYMDEYSYIDDDCDSYKLYQYAVQAYSVVNGQYTYGIQSDPSNSVGITKHEIARINRVCEVENGIQLAWDAIKSVDGYRILRRSNSDSEWAVIKTVDNSTATIDTEAPKDTYCYYSVQHYKIVSGIYMYGDFDDEGSVAFLHSHSSETFLVGDTVTLKANPKNTIAKNITGLALYFQYKVTEVSGHFVTLSYTVTKEIIDVIRNMGNSRFSTADFITMYGFTTDDYPTFVETIENGGSYDFTFTISSACCNRIAGANTDTDTETTTDTVTDSDTTTDTTTDTVTDSDTETDTTTDTVTDSDTETDTTTDTMTDSDTATDTTTDTVTDSDTETDTTTDTVTDSDTETDTTTDTVTDSDTETDSDYGFKTGDEVYLTSDAQNIDGWLISKSVLELNYQILTIQDNIATLIIEVDSEFLKSINMDLGQLFVAVGYMDYTSEDCPLDYNYLLNLINAGQEVSLTFKVHCKQLVSQKAEKPELLYGDANCDGDVNMVDVVTIQRIIAKLVDYANYGDNSESNCDCNHDGKVTMEDVTMLQRFVAKLIDIL